MRTFVHILSLFVMCTVAAYTIGLIIVWLVEAALQQVVPLLST
jgi:hypothetical protein